MISDAGKEPFGCHFTYNLLARNFARWLECKLGEMTSTKGIQSSQKKAAKFFKNATEEIVIV